MAQDLEKQLYHAACIGDAVLLKKLISNGVYVAYIYREDGGIRTPLYMAARNGHYECVRLLHEAGADIHGRCFGGHTPICVAASNGHLGIVQYLWENGADPLVKNDEGEDAYNKARNEGYSDVASYLRGKTRRDVKETDPQEVVFKTETAHLIIKEIFNFSLLERFTLVREIGDNRLGLQRDSFEKIAHEPRLRDAFNEHVRRGGSVAEEKVFGSGILVTKPATAPQLGKKNL